MATALISCCADANPRRWRSEVRLPATSSQTVGPYFQIGLSPLYRTELVGRDAVGDRVTIQGRVLDGDGQPVPDAVLEIWQADANGRYAHSPNPDSKPLAGGSFGFGRIPTDDGGNFRFTTIKPGSVAAPDGTAQAPHIVVSVFARGLLVRLVTRLYFPEEALNQEDFVLRLVEAGRRETLMAKPIGDQKDMREWNVVLQGAKETVFFDC